MRRNSQILQDRLARIRIAFQSLLHHRACAKRIAPLVALSMMGCKLSKAHASQGEFGLGISIFQPTGLTAKLKLSPTNALATTLGWSQNHLTVTGDYHAYVFKIEESSSNLDVFTHLGLGVHLSDQSGHQRLGLRVPMGASLEFQEIPVELGTEVAPVLGLFPATRFFFDLAVTARYFFE